MIRNIPPQYFWPGMVIAILGMSVIANIYLVTQAQSDGGAQIIDDYYDKAVAWDEAKAADAVSDSLGWTVTIDVQGTPNKKRLMQVTITDRDGAPVQGITPLVTVFDPRQIEAIGNTELKPVDGRFQGELPVYRDGLWDFVIEADANGTPFRMKQRIDVRSR